MASWLKAAEDLFDVVDRKAKVVVSELSNDTDSPVSASSGQDSQTRKTSSRSKEKGQLKTSSNESSKSAQSRKIKRIERIKPSASDQTLNNDNNNNNNIPINKETNIIDETKDSIVPDSENKIDETPVIENKIAFEKTEILNIESSKDENIKADTASDIKEGDLNVNKKDKEVVFEINQEKNESEIIEVSDKEIEKDNLSEKDQLNEAQGLLKTAVKTGKSKEARLARVCAGLSSRLQEYKSENSQLEELLIQERERCGSYEANIKQLEQELSVYKLEASRSELNMSDALLAKNTEIEALHGSIDALKKQVSNYEAKMASLQEDMESNKYSRELTETRVIQALREEVATAERRAEDERIAHNATKKAAVEREVELEHRAVEASNALARIQRASEESTSRASELEHKIAMLEVECASLHQQMQEMETKNRRAQKKPSEDANQLLQMQAWQEEVERARQSQREAENKISSLEAELQKMRVEMAGMKRDAEHYSRHEHVELEKRYRELTDLLYHKQTQLETMASEKAALEFQLEKELKRVQEAQVEAERTRAVRRIPSHWEEDTDIRVFDEPLPLHHRHIAAASQQLHKAAKILDSGAVRATRFLWRYPVARVILLFYLVFVHLFLMYLMHRLQEREVAALGMSNSMP